MYHFAIGMLAIVAALLTMVGTAAMIRHARIQRYGLAGGRLAILDRLPPYWPIACVFLSGTIGAIIAIARMIELGL